MEMERTAMNVKQQYMLYAASCVFVLLLCLLGIVWTFVGRLYRDLDGIMLLLTCLSLGGVFQLMLLYVAKEAGWIKFPSKKKTDAAKPAAGDGK